MNQYLALDARLARLLGYTDVEAHDLGLYKWITACPPGHVVTDRAAGAGRVTVPAWCCAGPMTSAVGDSGAMVDLMAQYEVDIEWRGACIRAVAYDDAADATNSHEELLGAHPDKARALRVAVVRAVIALLEHKES